MKLNSYTHTCIKGVKRIHILKFMLIFNNLTTVNYDIMYTTRGK